MNSRCLAYLAVLSLGPTAPVHGMMTEQIGPDRMHERQTTAQPGWPHGTVELVRDDSRVYSIWVNGDENFFFDAVPAELSGLLRRFSEMRMRDHVVRLKAATPNVGTLGGKIIHYNVHLHVQSGIALARGRQAGKSVDTQEPTLQIYLDPKNADELIEYIALPDNIILHNQIEDSELIGREKKPERALWHAKANFKNGRPACDHRHGVSTTAALWERGIPHPILIGQVSPRGAFSFPLSGHELDQLKAGQLTITLTAGNSATKPKADHHRLDPALISQNPAEAKPTVLDMPTYYHGRILFEDGSPPKLDPLPWPGAELGVNFSFAGQVTPDAKGYFQVFFTEDQFEELVDKKVRKNIYVPSYERRNSSRALHAFPASKLSRDKAKAGVVKIPKPSPRE